MFCGAQEGWTDGEVAGMEQMCVFGSSASSPSLLPTLSVAFDREKLAIRLIVFHAAEDASEKWLSALLCFGASALWNGGTNGWYGWCIYSIDCDAWI